MIIRADNSQSESENIVTLYHRYIVMTLKTYTKNTVTHHNEIM